MKHMNKAAIALLGLVFVLTTAGSVNAVLITFDEYAVGTAISTQYLPLGVEFSVTGAVHSTELPQIANDFPDPGWGQVLSPSPLYAGDFLMLFTNPVYCVSFDAGYWNGVGDPYFDGAVVEVYDPWGAQIGIVQNQFTINDIGFSYEHFDLSGFGPIGSVRFDSFHDVAGGAMDNLEFCAVPEPGTIALLGLGLAGLAARRRRKS